MRCLGLTEERRRCPAEAEGSGSYCAEHRRNRHDGLASGIRNDGGSSVARVLGRLTGGQARANLKDDARFDIPAWLRASPTAAVVHLLLGDANILTRWSAAFTLRKRHDPAAIDPLWQALLHDRSSLVRQQAAVALGKTAHPAVLAPLVEGLWHDPDAGVRQACAIALGNLGYRDAAGELAAALQKEPAAFVRWDCVLALGRLGDRAVEPVLAALAENEPAQMVREASRAALADIRRRR